MPQRAHTFKVNWCLKVHNAHLKLLSPISGYVHTYLSVIASNDVYTHLYHLEEINLWEMYVFLLEFLSDICNNGPFVI